MSDAPIPPALTPEEWAGVREDFANEWAAGHRLRHQLLPDCAVEFWEYTRSGRGSPHVSMVLVDEENHVSVDRRHALAALALHGQPFGFTREDVVACDLAAHLTRDTAEAEPARTLLVLAAKIRALLPPEP
jgi:hypothetical protein